jgi:glyoxylase-like metal-dependent hydrolase (beta-lactamase superfamily II)
MSFTEQFENIYCIDTRMFGFKQYCAAYLIKGKELALIDTGMASQKTALLEGIQAHGFNVSEISNIFVSHCDHFDHSGNVGTIIHENPSAKVYIHPSGIESLTHPEISSENRKLRMPPAMAARYGESVPTPSSRIRLVKDGEIFDLGENVKLQVIFASGHQPDGIVLYEHQHKGLFVNDLVGNYFADAGCSYALNPLNSDHQQAITSLRTLLELPLERLYLGHYGIILENPKEVIHRAIHNMQQLLDIGLQCVREGKPENIAPKFWEIYMPELIKLRKGRGETLYRYATQEHLPDQIKAFTKYCQEKFKEAGR